MPQFLRFHVLYNKPNLAPGHQYWQITARPSDDGSMFEVRMWGGEVTQTEPKFDHENPDAEYTSHPTAESAMKEADDERDQRIVNGWILFQQ